ncbi:MAG: family 10 glycosylhydrolase [Planctomycetes bacterium]|nr:family 10 glycosylhydrolase [Planctomycetota bacterium]
MKRTRRRTFRIIAMLLATTVAFSVQSGCTWFRLKPKAPTPAHTQPKPPSKTVERKPVRAIWVTRYDFATADDVRKIISNCASAGFNTILFQVRGNGTVSYPSQIEPWAEQFDHTSPGYDPLALAIEEAHRYGLAIEAWVNVMPAWRGPNEPTTHNQLYFTHPEWFWYDPMGRRQPLNHTAGGKSRGWYVSLNPCLPEVRNYLVSVFHELVSRYDIDGLHMDYIRFPNESVVPGERIPDYPRDARTLELFHRHTRQNPDQNPQAWNHWRTNQVTQLVADIHTMIKRTKPRIKLTAAVGSVRQSGLTHFQDAQRWMQDGIVDTVYLMNYTSSPPKFAQRLQPWMTVQGKAAVVPGLSITDTLEPKPASEIATEQINIAVNTTQNFAVFAYSTLFGSPNKTFAKQSQTEQKKRTIRRDVIIPRIQSLARDN